MRWLLKVSSLILVVVVVIALVPHSLVNVEVMNEMLPIKKEPGMKLIGLISDTHIPSRAEELPDKVFKIFKDVDMIIHAGDLTRMDVVKELEKIAPVLPVHGNMDPYDARTELPEMNLVEAYGWKIGVIHDPGALWGMSEMKKVAKKNDFNILVFGHTHRQSLKWEDGILFTNPGSPTDPLPPLLVKPTVGLLVITEEGVKPLIIRL